MVKKSASKRTPVSVFVGAAIAAAAANLAFSAELPVPCVAGACGANVAGWVTSGAATGSATGNTFTVNQASERAIFNWQSFNVSADGKVIFKQPDGSSIALNRIFQDAPSRIFGAIEANGQVYLVNPNGMVFGSTAKVNTAGLLASTLSISPSDFEAGLLAPEILQQGRAVLAADGRKHVQDLAGNEVLGTDGKPIDIQLTVEKGATIKTSGAGGRVLLASRKVENAGSIETPDGQAIVAAGEKVYLQSSTDPGLRGLLVEVDTGGEEWEKLNSGTVTNAVSGSISAPRGNVSIVGLAVNQLGRISATTTVAANGSVRLLARSGTIVQPGSPPTPVATRGGFVTLGEKSSIDISPELDSALTAVDEQTQLPSTVTITGKQVVMLGGASIVAHGGQVNVTARSNPSSETGTDFGSRIHVEAGATIDVSGSNAVVPVTRNLVSVELRANELKDSPLQRDSVVRGKTVVVDARLGTPLADVSGALAAIPKGVAERTSTGGTAKFDSEGDVVVAKGARIDVSGGKIDYTGGTVQTTQLMRADGRIFDISQADPNWNYIAVFSPTQKITYDRWGVTETVTGPAMSRYEEGYVFGSAAGTLQFAAPNMALAGLFQGFVTPGIQQRTPSTHPQGGTFIIGLPSGLSGTPDYRAPSVSLVNQAATLVVSPDTSLPGPRTLELPVDFLTSGGFRRADIYSNGVVRVEESTPLNLAPGSTLNLFGQHVELLSNISTPGGAVRVTAGNTVGVGGGLAPYRAGAEIADGVTIDVSGRWVNDAVELSPGASMLLDRSLYIDGGQITLDVKSDAGELIVGEGVNLLASGGAWLQRSGSVKGGNGGGIALRAAGVNSAFEIGDDVRIEAYGLAGARGGSFSLSAPRIEVATGSKWIEAQRVDTLDEESGFLRIGTPLFSEFGFASIDLNANGPTIAAPTPDDDEEIPTAPSEPVDIPPEVFAVRSGTVVDTRVKSLLLQPNALDRPTGGNIRGLSNVALDIDYSRNAASISMGAKPVNFNQPSRLGDLIVEKGAQLFGDPGSSFSFAAVGSVILDGQISAKGGRISASIGAPSQELDPGYRAETRIELGSSAILDVAGTTLYKPNATGALTGKVIAGGSVDFVTLRGSIVMREGSLVDVSGTAGLLDIPAATGSSTFTRQLVASAGGSLNLQAPEAIVFGGRFNAHAGVGDTGVVHAGSLAVRLTRTGWSGGLLGDTYPTGPRLVRVVADRVAVSPDSPPNGLAILNVDKIRDSGIDSLLLEGGSGIEFGGDVSLSLARQITLDSPSIASRGGAISLTAPLVSLGNSLSGTLSTAAVAGPGKLTVQADNISLLGAFNLDGFADAKLASRGDMQLRGFERDGTSTGSMGIAGDLTLEAARIYPSTETKYSILVAGGEDDVLRVNRAGSASYGVPLSVNGSLTLTAREIEFAGNVAAPFGTITLNGTDKVTIADGSTLSVSAKGALLPYGRIRNETDWVYDVTGNEIDKKAVPERRVNINGQDVTLASGATIDLQGGGDLYAYEWLPGTGGSRDILSPSVSPGLYAIMPSNQGQLAPYDPSAFNGTGLKLGDSVYLSGVGDLPAGTYALLPARYALLPGAYLVKAVAGYDGIQSGVPRTLADGTPVIAGRFTFAGTGIGDAQLSGFSVLPGSVSRTLASYTDSVASRFYPARALRLDEDRAPLPADAGILSLNVQRSLDAKGKALLGAAEGGLGGALEIAAPRLIVAGTNGGLAVAPGIVMISSTQLAQWNPSRLLLGGLRDTSPSTPAETDEAGFRISVGADSVTFMNGAQVKGDEVIVVARESIRFDDGTSLSSSARTSGSPALEPGKIKLTGEGASQAAVVGVTNQSLLEVDRGGPLASADLARVALLAGSQISSGGSLLLDSPGGATLAGTLDAHDADLALSSGFVRFGDDDLDGALTIDSRIQQALARANSVRLASAGAIEFARDVSLLGNGTHAIDAITLSAAALRNRDEHAVSFTANTINLAGSTTAATATLGGGTLDLNSKTLRIGPGTLAVDGFGQTTLAASGSIIGTKGTGELLVAGPLDISSALLTAESGSALTIRSDDLLSATRSSGAASEPLQLGGTLTLAGKDVTFGGTILTPSGIATLQATNDLTLAADAIVDTSGVLVRAVDQVVGSTGGAIRLSAGHDLQALAGSLLAANGISDTDAGILSARADGAMNLDGTMSALAGTSGRGGTFTLDAGTLNTGLAALSSQLGAGGFNQRATVRVTDGDLVLPVGSKLSAGLVELTTDTGHVQVGGEIDAAGGDGAGEMRLIGGAGVTLESTGVLRAASTDASGGSIFLGTTTGSISLARDSLISTGDRNQQGKVRLRAPRVGNNDVAITDIGSRFENTYSVVIEPFVVETLTAPTLTTATFTALTNNTSINGRLKTYMSAAAGNIKSRFSSLGSALTVEAGIELRRDGDLTIQRAVGPNTPTVMDFSGAAWRFDDQPVALTIRATGNINVNIGVTDGFRTIGQGTAQRTDLIAGNSATIRMAAGADLTSADTLATVLGGTGNLSIGANGSVRTGTGDLQLVAANDLKFLGANSTAYTAGTAGLDTIVLGRGASIALPTKGGNLLLNAGNDVIGSAVSLSPSIWESRQGTSGETGTDTAWGIDIKSFAWNAGTFGGGNLSVRAGHNVKELSAAAVDSARETAPDTMTRLGGGALSIVADGDITSVMVHASRGTNLLRAGGELGRSRDQLGSFLSIQNAQLDLVARNGIAIQTVLNPTVLPRPDATVPFFYTFEDDSALRATTASGLLALAADPEAARPFLGDATASLVSAKSTLATAPPNLSLRSLSGDLTLAGGSFYLYPSATGQLELFAFRDIAMTGGGQMVLSDASPTALGTPFAPSDTGTGATNDISRAAAASRHRGDLVPALITAGRDINEGNFDLAKATRMVAGRDIFDLTLLNQNLQASDLTLISAGRDLRYSSAQDQAQIQTGGPGRLDILAGRQIDLGFSRGITTIGALRNPTLPDDGAAITVAAGLNQPLNVPGFMDAIVAKSADYKKDLVDYVAKQTGKAGLTYDDAAKEFAKLNAEQQQPFAINVFFAELVKAGREANEDPKTEFKRGYAAIDALFPHSRDPDGKGTDNPYLGDLKLAFSRIYSLAGGDLSLLVPGGLLNVGLANPPPSLATSRSPSELGIVAQGAGSVRIFTSGDQLVNQSRVFTLGGGDIAAWSTLGNIDAGRGAKSAISAPPPSITVDDAGNVKLDFGRVASGSGIRTITTLEGVEPGDVDLIAPVGTVNAGDAGIGAAGNINIAAQQVVGLDNIQVGGTATGVPAETSSLGASLSGVSASASSATSGAGSNVGNSATEEQKASPLAEGALSWLDVFVEGFGEEACKANDVECLKRAQEK